MLLVRPENGSECDSFVTSFYLLEMKTAAVTFLMRVPFQKRTLEGGKDKNTKTVLFIFFY